MGIIQRKIKVVAAAVGLLTLLAVTSPTRATAHDGPYVTVSYCELIHNTERYNGKLVRVSAIYRYGFEWSELYCTECVNEPRTWVDPDESFVSSTKPGLRKKIGEHGFKGRTVKVTMLGRFSAGGGYGHMAAYRFRFLVSRLEKADVILNDSPSPNAVPKKVLSKIRCYDPMSN